MPKNATKRPLAEHDDAVRHRSRTDQLLALSDRALYTVVQDAEDPDAAGVMLELYVKEQPLGAGYVCDFTYSDPKLPITVYGILLRGPTGLIIGELELFRAQWGYFNDYGDYVGPDGDWRAKDDEQWDVSARSEHVPERPSFEGISGALLRNIPVGRILAWAHEAMAGVEWRAEGLRMLGPDGINVVPVSDLPSKVLEALERTSSVPTRRRGRPPLPDDLLERVALAYLEEAKRGRGLTRRLAARLGRPEETVRDWIHTSRVRGFLSPGVEGRRGALPGERLLAPTDTEEDR